MFEPNSILHVESSSIIGQTKLNNVVYRIDENTAVSITESIDLSKIYRCIDEQSGSHILFTPTYIVRVYRTKRDNNNHKTFLTSVHKMTMDEVFTAYPWFFEILRSI